MRWRRRRSGCRRVGAQLQDERQKSSLNAEAQIEKLKQKLQQLSSSRDQAEWKAAQARRG